MGDLILNLITLKTVYTMFVNPPFKFNSNLDPNLIYFNANPYFS